MGSLSKHTRLSKLIILLLVVHTVILVLLAIPFRFIFDDLFLGSEFYPNTGGLLAPTLFALIYVWYRPRENVARAMIGITIFGDCLFSLLMFLVISDLQIILFLLYFFPVLPLLYYAVTVEVTKKSEISKDFRFDVFVVKILAHDDVVEGLDNVLSSLSVELKGDTVLDQERHFLEYISQREDELGNLARERLDNYL